MEIKGYLPDGLEMLAKTVEAISMPRNRCYFSFPARIMLTDPNGGPYGELAWDAAAYTYRFFPDSSRGLAQ